MPVYGVPTNPVSGVERLREPKHIHLDVLEPEEVWALVRAADDEQDAAFFLTAALPDCGWASCSRCAGATSTSHARRSACARATRAGALTSPKSGKVRAVPMAPEVAEALARLADREHSTGDEDLVFPGTLRATSTTPRSGAATRRRSARRPAASCASTTCATRSARG